jgi:hypothetical protein
MYTVVYSCIFAVNTYMEQVRNLKLLCSVLQILPNRKKMSTQLKRNEPMPWPHRENISVLFSISVNLRIFSLESEICLLDAFID